MRPALDREQRGGAGSQGPASRTLHDLSRPRSIRSSVIFAAATLTTIAVIATGLVSEQNLRRAVTREVQARLIIEARHLALVSTQALLTDYPELTLHPIAKALKARQPELEMVLVADRSGTIEGDPDVRRLGLHYVRNPHLQPISTSAPLEPGEALLSDGQILVGFSPVKQPDGRQLGTAQVGMRRDYVDHLLSAARRQQAIVLALVLLMAVGTVSFLMSKLLKPISVLREGLERIGRGDLDTPLQLRDRTEIGVLADSVNRMASELRTAQARMVERERLAHEVDLARQIQTSLLPNRPLEDDGWVVEGSNRAAAEVGGDYYDYFPLPGGRVGIAIADVSGKGLAGCMVMSMLSALLRACRDAHTSPARLLADLDTQLAHSLQPGTFITMFYGILDPQTGELVHASAGHTPALVYRAGQGQLEWVRGRGIPLGSVRGGQVAKTLEDGILRLEAGDALVQFTDGVNEAFSSSSEEQFGFARVEEVVLQTAGAGSLSFITAIHRAVEIWSGDRPPADDETLVMVRMKRSLPARRESDQAPLTGTDGRARHEPDGSRPFSGPLLLLREAREQGHQLRLAATLEDMARIQDWLREILPPEWSEGKNFSLLSTAVHETCANIAEHGCGLDPRKTIDVWWVHGGGGASGSPAASEDSGKAGGLDGHFVVLDQGVQFRPGPPDRIDYGDPAVWRRGRGFGLDIIHRVMRDVRFHPGTPEGNITLLRFSEAEGQEELRYA